MDGWSTRCSAAVPPRLPRAHANRCVSRQSAAEQRREDILWHGPADETCTFLFHPVSPLLPANLSLPLCSLTRTPSEGTLSRRISALPRSSNSSLRGERRSPATHTGSVRPRRARARTSHARLGRVFRTTGWCAVRPLARPYTTTRVITTTTAP
jgi:hypothetical protein